MGILCPPARPSPKQPWQGCTGRAGGGGLARPRSPRAAQGQPKAPSWTRRKTKTRIQEQAGSEQRGRAGSGGRALLRTTRLIWLNGT